MVTASSRRRRAPTRRPRHRYRPIKLGRRPWIVRAAAALLLVLAALILWAFIAQRLAPVSNTSRDHFDVIVVLGTPADDDGNPTPQQLARVTEAVREYERGVAPRLLFTGGAAKNRYIEADVMAGVAAAQGIPPSAIFVETRARDTIQNACYATQVMRDHGWHAAEIVSSGFHLPRSSLIFSRTAIDWRMHAAPSLPGESSRGWISVLELAKTVRYLTYASWAEGCET